VTQKCPLLLLDDIFEKIDADRAQRLIELVGETSFGQILITDTHASRVETHFSGIKAEKLHHQIG
jgi:DNA replication and repair protein RecF